MLCLTSALQLMRFQTLSFFTFAHYSEIQHKIKSKYESFISGEKSIFVCSCPTFRGLQHAKITVVIDRNIYNVQHYLVETLARCTADFCIAVLKNSSTLKNVTAKWKSKQMIEQWNIEICNDAAAREYSFKSEWRTLKTVKSLMQSSVLNIIRSWKKNWAIINWR